MPPQKKREMPPLPSFLIIGAQRCATRWLRFNLDKHPEVYAPNKELNYFNDPERMSEIKLTGYRWLFDSWDEEPIIGESSPAYMRPSFHTGQMSQRIRRSLPDVKLIAMVRNPIDRHESAMRAYLKSGHLPQGVDLNAELWTNPEQYRHLDLLSAGLYAKCLRPYQHRFGDRLLIVFHEDIVADPAAVYRTVLTHIGADPDVVPRDLHKVMFSTRSSVRYTPLDQAQREFVYTLFKSDVEQFEEMTGRDLRHWDPSHAQEQAS